MFDYNELSTILDCLKMYDSTMHLHCVCCEKPWKDSGDEFEQNCDVYKKRKELDDLIWKTKRELVRNVKIK